MFPESYLESISKEGHQRSNKKVVWGGVCPLVSAESTITWNCDAFVLHRTRLSPLSKTSAKPLRRAKKKKHRRSRRNSWSLIPEQAAVVRRIIFLFQHTINFNIFSMFYRCLKSPPHCLISALWFYSRTKNC